MQPRLRGLARQSERRGDLVDGAFLDIAQQDDAAGPSPTAARAGGRRGRQGCRPAARDAPAAGTRA